MTFKLGRRALLRGAGVAVGLPLLDAMLDGRGSLLGTAHAQTNNGIPVRLINYFWPNGVNRADFFRPNGISRAPLVDVLGDINFVNGLSNTYIMDFNRNGGLSAQGSHGCGGAGFATMVTVTTSGAGGPSFDQLAAAQLGTTTKLRTLVVSGQARTAYSSHFHNQSWVGRNNPAEPIRDPLRAYDALFAGMTTPTNPSVPAAPSTLVRDRRSVLDLVLRDADRLNGKLGSTDRARLEEHMTAIRSLEQQLENLPAEGGGSGGGGATCQVPTKPAAPGGADITARANIYANLIARALACDLTRFVTYQVTDAMYSGAFIADGGASNDHSLSHTSNGALIARTTAAKMQHLATLIKALKAIPEGNGTLLDNVALFASSEIGDSVAHDPNNLPVIQAGRGGGKIVTGRTLNFSGRSTADLHTSLLQAAGMNIAKFGNAAGPLPGLLT